MTAKSPSPLRSLDRAAAQAAAAARFAATWATPDVAYAELDSPFRHPCSPRAPRGASSPLSYTDHDGGADAVLERPSPRQLSPRVLEAPARSTPCAASSRSTSPGTRSASTCRSTGRSSRPSAAACSARGAIPFGEVGPTRGRRAGGQ